MRTIQMEVSEETYQTLEEFKDDWGLKWGGVASVMAEVCDDIQIGLQMRNTSSLPGLSTDPPEDVEEGAQDQQSDRPPERGGGDGGDDDEDGPSAGSDPGR